MSAYDNDPRVRKTNSCQYRVVADDLYLVTAWGEEHWTVALSADARTYDDPAVFADMLRRPNPAPHLYPTADEAIRSLIGDPR